MYSENGYQILCRNFRTRSGEIDIVCRKGDVLVFSEVKSIPRTWNEEDMQKKIPPAKVRRIKTAAGQYLAQNPDDVYDVIRFDAVFVSGWRTTCIQGAF